MEEGGGGKEKKLVGKWWLIFKPQKRPTFGPQKLEVVGGNQFNKYIDPPPPFKKVNKQTMWWEARSTIRFKQTANK